MVYESPLEAALERFEIRLEARLEGMLLAHAADQRHHVDELGRTVRDLANEIRAHDTRIKAAEAEARRAREEAATAWQRAFDSEHRLKVSLEAIAEDVDAAVKPLRENDAKQNEALGAIQTAIRTGTTQSEKRFDRRLALTATVIVALVPVLNKLVDALFGGR